MVDARLPDGSRVNAIIAPLSLSGPLLTIRKFSRRRLSLEDMINIGSLSEQSVEFLSRCIEAQCNILISGGTGAGKTTLLNALSQAIPDNERIVTIEDAAELQLNQRHVLRLEARPPNIEGEGAIPIRDLVRNSLRMRPDRIIVGECRGQEALDMLQAMNTGHDGSLSTVHGRDRGAADGVGRHHPAGHLRVQGRIVRPGRHDQRQVAADGLATDLPREVRKARGRPPRRPLRAPSDAHERRGSPPVRRRSGFLVVAAVAATVAALGAPLATAADESGVQVVEAGSALFPDR